MINWIKKLLSTTSKLTTPPVCQHRYVTVKHTDRLYRGATHPICVDCGKAAENWIISFRGWIND